MISFFFVKLDVILLLVDEAGTVGEMTSMLLEPRSRTEEDEKPYPETAGTGDPCPRYRLRLIKMTL